VVVEMRLQDGGYGFTRYGSVCGGFFIPPPLPAQAFALHHWIICSATSFFFFPSSFIFFYFSLPIFFLCLIEPRWKSGCAFCTFFFFFDQYFRDADPFIQSLLGAANLLRRVSFVHSSLFTVFTDRGVLSMMPTFSCNDISREYSVFSARFNILGTFFFLVWICRMCERTRYSGQTRGVDDNYVFVVPVNVQDTTRTE